MSYAVLADGLNGRTAVARIGADRGISVAVGIALVADRHAEVTARRRRDSVGAVPPGGR